MNVPNLITLSRLVITALCVVSLELIPEPARPDPVLAWMAFGTFVFAAATDFVDGYLARALGQVTTFGRVADPFVDKVLICGTFVILLKFEAVQEFLPNWLVVVIIAREFLVTSVRALAEAAGIPFPADWLGKLKMVVQSVTAAALLTLVAGTRFWTWVAEPGIWLSLVITVWSGLAYCWKARTLLRPSVTNRA